MYLRLVLEKPRISGKDFKGVEFDTFKKEAGLNSFRLTPKKWIDSTGAIGVQSRAGRYGGTYVHKDITFEFGSWLSPEFKLYLINVKGILIKPSALS
jgi:hypothetical protein